MHNEPTSLIHQIIDSYLCAESYKYKLFSQVNVHLYIYSYSLFHSCHNYFRTETCGSQREDECGLNILMACTMLCWIPVLSQLFGAIFCICLALFTSTLCCLHLFCTVCGLPRTQNGTYRSSPAWV